MDVKLLLIGILFIFLILLVKDYSRNLKIDENFSISISSDKFVYSSNEMAKLKVTIESPEDFEQARIKVFGIVPRGYAFLNEEKIINLSKGANRFEFSVRMPACTRGCGGVYPGFYNISVEMFIGNKTFSNFTTIELKE